MSERFCDKTGVELEHLEPEVWEDLTEDELNRLLFYYEVQLPRFTSKTYSGAIEKLAATIHRKEK